MTKTSIQCPHCSAQQAIEITADNGVVMAYNCTNEKCKKHFYVRVELKATRFDPRTVNKLTLKSLIDSGTCPNCGMYMGFASHGICEKCKEYCGCSFDPTSSSDYCESHRPR